jgi:hypothetical protein
MKTTHSLLLLAALAPAALLLPGCSKDDNATSTPAVGITDTASASWDTIKDYTFEKRDEFVAGFDRMTAKMDDDRQAANAKADGLSASAAQERDSARKDYDAARADLKANLAALSNASADTWSAAKDKVAQSWQAVQKAYDRMKASVTS